MITIFNKVFCSLQKKLTIFIYKVSGTQDIKSVITAHSNHTVASNHNLSCKCGWTGKSLEGIKKYQKLNEDAVELELFCARCKKYLGFKLYKNAA